VKKMRKTKKKKHEKKINAYLQSDFQPILEFVVPDK